MPATTAAAAKMVIHFNVYGLPSSQSFVRHNKKNRNEDDVEREKNVNRSIHIFFLDSIYVFSLNTISVTVYGWNY